MYTYVCKEVSTIVYNLLNNNMVARWNTNSTHHFIKIIYSTIKICEAYMYIPYIYIWGGIFWDVCIDFILCQISANYI